MILLSEKCTIERMCATILLATWFDCYIFCVHVLETVTVWVLSTILWFHVCMPYSFAGTGRGDGKSQCSNIVPISALLMNVNGNIL